MSANWFSITAAVDKNAAVEVFIYSQIGEDWWGDGTSARNFISALQEHKGRKLKLRMNSPGGVVTDGLAIYNYLKGRGNVDVIIDGYVASIATIIALAGDTITIAKNGLFMIHNVSGGVRGNEKDVRQYADMLAKFNTQLVNTYVDETGRTENNVRAWMDAETWFTAAEAVQHGFATALGNEVALVAHAGIAEFRNAPASLRAAVDSKTNNDMTPEQIAAASKPVIVEASDSLFDKLKALISGDPALRAKVTELEGQITAHAGIVAAKDLEITNLKSAHATEISTLKAEHATALETAKKTSAAQTLAKTGVTAVNVQAEDPTAGAKTKREQYNAILASGDAKTAGEFYAANKEDILSGK